MYRSFVRWEEAGVTENLLTVLRVKARLAQGRAPEPSAGVLDAQSVKGSDTVSMLGDRPAVTPIQTRDQTTVGGVQSLTSTTKHIHEASGDPS